MQQDISPFAVSNDTIASIRQAFINYTNRFSSTDAVYREHIDLKIAHTSRVCVEIEQIALSCRLNQPQRNFVELLGLLHDVGRFKQWHVYRTFNDVESDNHARLSVEVIEEEHMLDILPVPFQKVIKQVILLHNIPLIPEDEPYLIQWYAKMLRDADKIDIWNLNIQHNVGHRILSDALPATYTPDERLLNCFRNHRIITIDMVDSFFDILLFRLSWVFNLNFTYTFGKAVELGIVHALLDKLPMFEEKEELRELLNEYISFQLGPDSSAVPFVP